MSARIVFDLDGTLIDSAPDIRACANNVLAEEGAEPLSLDETRRFIGNGTSVFVARMRQARAIPDTAQDRLHDAFVRDYEAFVDLTEVYPGVPQALTALRDAGHGLGICTNKPLAPCNAVLRHLGLRDMFQTVWGGDSLPVRKPDPAPLKAALGALGTGPCLYVGDSEVDAETAQRAGVPFILFTKGYRKAAADALPQIARFSDFANLPGLVRQGLSG